MQEEKGRRENRTGNEEFQKGSIMERYYQEEIECASRERIKEIQDEKRDLLESLETYYRVFFLQED